MDDDIIKPTSIDVIHEGQDPAFEVTCEMRWTDEAVRIQRDIMKPGDLVNGQLERVRYQKIIGFTPPNVEVRMVWRTEMGTWKSWGTFSG